MVTSVYLSFHIVETVVAFLSVTQLFLLLFSFGLAREVFILRAQKQTDEDWPLLTLLPGESLPENLQQALAAGGVRPLGTLLLCAISSADLRQMLTSLAIACRNWSSDLVLVSESQELISCCKDLIVSVPGGVHIVTGLSQNLGLASNAIIFTQNGRVVDASCVTKTPSSIRNRFSFVAS